MRGFQPNKKANCYADGGLVDGFKMAFGLKQRMRDTPEYQQMMRSQQPAQQAPAQTTPAMAKAKPAISQYAGNDALKRRMQEADSYANGGMVRGKGTGTSDEIQDEVPDGTYIMPADTTKTVGADALRKLGNGNVPVNLSNGEFKMPPEQVHAVGVQALNQIKDATHTPVQRGLPIQTRDGEPRMFFNGGGDVDLEKWQQASDALRQSNDRIAASQGRMNIQQPDGRFDENKLAQAAEMVRQSRARMAQNTMLSNRGFAAADVPRQYLADGGNTKHPEGLDKWKAAADMARASQERIAANRAQAATDLDNIKQQQAATQNMNSRTGGAGVTGLSPAGEMVAKGFRSREQAAQQMEGAGNSAGAAGARASNLIQSFGSAFDAIGQTTRDKASQGLDPVFRFGSALTGGNGGMATSLTPNDKPATAAAEVPPPATSVPASDIVPPAADKTPGASTDNSPTGSSNTAPAPRQVEGTNAYEHSRGNYSDNPAGMGFGNFTGQPNAQNMNAANALSARYGNEVRGMALGGGQPQTQQINAPTVLSSANDWASRNALRNMGVSANSIMNRPGGASGSVSGGRGRNRQQPQASDPTGAVARYNAAVSADLQKQGMQPQGDLAAMKENAALQREGLQQDGANNRLSSQNDLKRQELGMLADKNAQDSQMRGFDFRQAQRKEGILSQYDQAKTPEARDALIKQFPDVFGRDKNATWKGIALQGGTDALGNKTESTLAAYNEGTGEFRRFDQGAQQQSAGKQERAVGSTSTVNGKTAVWDGSKWVPR